MSAGIYLFHLLNQKVEATFGKSGAWWFWVVFAMVWFAGLHLLTKHYTLKEARKGLTGEDGGPPLSEGGEH